VAITTPDIRNVLVLGVGNLLWADEGFGVRAVEALNAGYRFPAGVRLMDGGTQGLFLLPWVCSAESLLIFDAIDFGLEPGTLKVIRGDQVPRYMGAKKVSMHQLGFQEVLATAELSDSLPNTIALVGVQPDTLDDYGGSLRPAIRARLGDAIGEGLRVLAEWGVRFEARPDQGAFTEAIGPLALAMDRYESGRPVPPQQIIA